MNSLVGTRRLPPVMADDLVILPGLLSWCVLPLIAEPILGFPKVKDNGLFDSLIFSSKSQPRFVAESAHQIPDFPAAFGIAQSLVHDPVSVWRQLYLSISERVSPCEVEVNNGDQRWLASEVGSLLS